MRRDSIQRAFRNADPRTLRSHVGLWIDKMLEAEVPSSEEAGPHLRAILSAPLPDGYAEGFRMRHGELLRAADADEATVIELDAKGSRLLIGLGAKGVLEMGITLDHTWGLPYIPGTALKGLCAAAAHQLTDDPSWRKPEGWPEAAPPESRRGAASTDYELLFGTTANAGLVRFHDAWWRPAGNEIPLLADVMTVHHGDYYQALPGAPAPPPTDFDEPTPVPFLTTRGTFVGALEGPARWREVACQLLEAGLRDLGIGAKTASGYGRMKLSVEKTPIVRAREAALDALGNAFRGYQAGHRSKGIEVVVNALARDLDLQRVADALRPLAKDLRRSLLDGVREKMTDTTRLDALIALLTEVPSPVIVEAPRPAPAQVSAPATSRRRVRYRKDPKDPKRFFVEIEGDKERKGHTVAFGEGVLDRLRVAGDWLELTVTIDGNKPTITD